MFPYLPSSTTPNMETSTGHVLPGLGFFLVGLWHIFNQTKLHVTHSNSNNFSNLWFPSPKIRHLELYAIILASIAFMSLEVLIGLHTHFDPDGTIPFGKLRKFEHANIAVTFTVYAILAIILDKNTPPAKSGMTQLLGAVIFSQELISFHLHSTDHMGVEGQYHFLLQIVILISLSTTLLGFPFPGSFMNGFVRSCSIMFQGIWLVVMGVMLWTPEYVPKGCFYKTEHRHRVVRCREEEADMRAKALVNIQFSWYVIGFSVFVVTLYLALVKLYSGNVAYRSLPRDDQKEELVHDVEMGKLCAVLDIK